jgi:hypothetical protein
MGLTFTRKQIINSLFILLSSISAAIVFAPDARAAVVVVEHKGNLGVIKGIVRDDAGSPISDATVAIFRTGTSKLLKQVSSAADGSFLAKIVPGTYTVLAVAQGFNPMTLFGIEVGRAAELTYGFRLERSGSGNTLPEKRADRNSSKWRIRAAQTQRSIYQNREGNAPRTTDAAAAIETDRADTLADADPDVRESGRKGHGVVETYFAGSDTGNYAGINFAALIPQGEKSEIVFIGQAGKGKNAPQRFEATIKYRPNANHQLRLNSSVGRLGTVVTSNQETPLGQFAFQATDEWKVREGIIFVYGLDYAHFMGAGSDWSASPRFGLQIDINAKTRLRAAFTPQTEERSWADAVDLEGESVAFAEPVAVDDLVVVSGKPRMNRSNRLELGVERVIDNRSSIEANAFFDTTIGHGVGLDSLAFDPLSGDGFSEFVADQQGRSQGIRVVYTRRLNSLFTTSAGYSFGNGQKLSPAGITDPMHVFESSFFQSFFGQLAADLRTGTSVKTVFRLSPQATVFAIDPFKGRLAIYDPGLSVLITQSLPNLGLPIRAEAILDARNLFDFQAGVLGDEGSLRLNSQGRILRGGIQVRF